MNVLCVIKAPDLGRANPYTLIMDIDGVLCGYCIDAVDELEAFVIGKELKPGDSLRCDPGLFNPWRLTADNVGSELAAYLKAHPMVKELIDARNR